MSERPVHRVCDDVKEKIMQEGVPKSLVSLLDGVVDFAGLFPPASLAMPAMVQEFAEGLAHPMAWMLGRLIVPVGQLEDFAKSAAEVLPREEEEDPWFLSVLVSPADSDGLADEIAQLAAFNAHHCQAEHGLILADMIELRAASPAAIESALEVMPDDVFPFFELPTAEDCRGHLAALAGADAAAKIRTGGVTPELNPPTAQVGRFIYHCAQAGVPFKATAGLHHPLPNEASHIPAHQQGFLNVLVAAALAATGGGDEADLLEVLDFVDHVQVSDHELHWNHVSLTREQIEECRATLAISFGSCSWREPVADLQALGLLPRPNAAATS